MKTLDRSALSRVRGGVGHTPPESTGGIWDTLKEWGAPMLAGAATGAGIGALGGTLVSPGIGTAIGAGVGGLIGGVGGLIGHGLDKLMGNTTGQSQSAPLEPEKPLGLGPQLVGKDDKAKPEEVQQVVQKAKESGASDKEVEEMITLYHISNAPGWAQRLAQKKGEGSGFDELGGLKINPDITKNKRTKDDPYGDGRGGDDLGPGFYTGNSPEFVDEYMKKNFNKDNPGGVLSFQVPKKSLQDLSHKEIGPDDDTEFQKYMKDGFSTFDTRKQELSLPKLDTGPRPFDLLSGPINDIDKATKLGPLMDGDVQTTQGAILKMGDKTPLQYNWATQKGVETLYGKSNDITYTDMNAWAQQREGQKQVQ